MKITSIRQGDRVELHPATDAWMMGDRYGTVRKVGRTVVHVYMDKSRRVRLIRPDNILTSERPYPDDPK